MKKITLLITLMITSLGFSQVPTTAAPTPPARNATDVISVYSDAYSNITPVNYTPYWSQPAGYVAPDPAFMIGGNNTYQLTHFSYQGIDWAGIPQNISGMEYLHVDIWTNNEAPNIYVISSGGEVPHAISSVAGSWQSLDIPITGITGNLTNANQFKFDNGTGGDIYIDNLYFWKNPAAAGTPTIGALTVPAKNTGDAPFTLVDPTSDSTGAFSYTSSDLTVATISGNTVTVVGAGTSVITATQAAAGSYIAGSVTANLVVTAAPMTAAPTPPNRNPGDVISLFSDAYANITIDNWNAGLGWGGGSPVSDVQIVGNNTKRIDFAPNNYIGVDFSGVGHHIDATAMTNFHMDIWSANTNLVGLVCNSKFSQWGGTAGEVSALEINYIPSTTGSGTWISIDAPLSTASGSQTRNDIAQFLITYVATPGTAVGSLFVDNIYLYKGTALGTANFQTSSVKLYPNPVTNTLNIEANSAIQKVSVYNLLGQEVMTASPKTNATTLQTSSLQKGVYMVTTEIDGKISTSKVVKE